VSKLDGTVKGVMAGLEELEDIDKTGKDEKSKTVKEKKIKRSFMLLKPTIQRLDLLKLAMTDSDLSEIVEVAVNEYFERNKDKIEKVVSIYQEVK
jgi:hypothetical protein